MTLNTAAVYLASFLGALVLALVTVPLMRTLAYKVGALDRGEWRKVHQGVVPRFGGMGIYLSFVLPLVALLLTVGGGQVARRLVGVLVGATIVLAVGVYDDIRGASIRNKLIAECLAGLVIWAWGIRIEAVTNPFGGTLHLGWMALPLTILWVVVITNAINLIDGLDGVAAGTGILIAGTLFILAGDKDPLLRLALVVLAGSLLGFLRHNFPPATIFMGDSGSLFLGFTLAALALISSFKATAAATLLVPILAFGHPLMDMAYAVLRRYYRGVPLGQADREHIHHKLLDRGISQRHVVLILYGVNLVGMLGVLLFLRRHVDLGLLPLILLVVVAVAGLRFLGYVEFSALLGENVRNFRINRKRRYINWVIKRFAREAERCRSLESLRKPLDSLMEEYGFTRVTIDLEGPGAGVPFYLLEKGEPDGRPLVLEFPILFEGRELGMVHVAKSMDDDSFLCTSEFARAVSEAIGGVIRRGAPA